MSDILIYHRTSQWSSIFLRQKGKTQFSCHAQPQVDYVVLLGLPIKIMNRVIYVANKCQVYTTKDSERHVTKHYNPRHTPVGCHCLTHRVMYTRA